MISPLEVLILFFVTLGPLKIIQPLYYLTYGINWEVRSRIVTRAVAISTAIVLAVALIGSFIVGKWGISVSANAITLGLILMLQSLTMIMNAPKPLQKPEHPATDPHIASFPLAIPTIVTAPGITAILTIFQSTREQRLFQLIILALLLLVMLLNLVFMLNIERIIHHVSLVALQVSFWIFAILQASVAVEIIIRALTKLNLVS
jgi:multiple antibiotic resistance protein